MRQGRPLSRVYKSPDGATVPLRVTRCCPEYGAHAGEPVQNGVHQYHGERPARLQGGPLAHVHRLRHLPGKSLISWFRPGPDLSNSFGAGATNTNSMCFRRKSSSVRRRYREFVWLRQSLLQNALIIELPKLPPWKPFFHLSSPEQVTMRMKGLQTFLETVVQYPLFLSDSRLHLFLQSELSVRRMERCARGRTRYTVAEAIQRSGSDCVSPAEDKSSCDSDYESCSSSSVLGLSVDTSLSGHFLDTSCGHALCLCEEQGSRGHAELS
uniref:Sorting nexin 10a n=1 Tax=Neogobius melanostomus TaxID=47308 RepID=A0A8C6T947_9GOBI